MLDAILVSRIFAPEPAAASYRLAAFADTWARAGGVMRVLTTRAPEGTTVDPVPYQVSRWPVKRAADGSVRGYLSYLSFDAPALLRLLAARRPDVVVTEPPPTTGAVVAVACALRRLPFAYYAADCWSDATAVTSAPRAVVSVVRALERFALRRAAVVLTVNDAIAARLRELAPGSNVEVVGNGVDTTIFTPRGERASVSGPTVVYTGTASEWQGAEIFVEAWPAVVARHPGARLRFVGAGASWPALRTLADDLGVGRSVELIDTVPPREAAAHLRAASLAVVSLKPGQAYDYALPTKLLAALACGTPALYVGEGVGADFVAAIDPGSASGTAPVAFEIAAVAAAIAAALDAPATAEQRARLGAWSHDQVSLSAVAARASNAVAEAARSARRHR